MLAMALLLHGGLLGGMGGEAAGVDGAGEGAWTLATPAEGFLAASGTGELAHLLHLCLFRAFPRGASLCLAKINTCTTYAIRRSALEAEGWVSGRSVETWCGPNVLKLLKLSSSSPSTSRSCATGSKV